MCSDALLIVSSPPPPYSPFFPLFPSPIPLLPPLPPPFFFFFLLLLYNHRPVFCSDAGAVIERGDNDEVVGNNHALVVFLGRELHLKEMTFFFFFFFFFKT